ncbi:PapD-like protein [Myxozyma melibiosi]|uniref:PapD-like protein n=1 Tax=Myxozyma melibiosi TaxID=54550 RepID=A0ABR1F0J4_9ASCO
MEVSPSTLEFSGPFSQSITRLVTLRNKTAEPLAYKVKTTAPKLYCVRPNASRVDPGETVEVQIILQGLKFEPGPDYKCKDKFLVQSVPIAAELETLSIHDLWSTVEKTSKEKIADAKIRVAYKSGTTSTSPDTPATPAAAAAAAVGSSFSTPSAPESTSSTSKSINSTTVVDEKIADLNSELKKAVPGDSVAGATEKSAPAGGAVEQRSGGGQGVPIPVAMVLCLIAFLLAWLFF